MIPPFLVIHRSGAQVVREESSLPPSIRAQFVERRKHRPIWWACHGFMVGVCGSYLMVTVAAFDEVSAGLSQWANPSGLMAGVSFLTMVFAVGQMWNARVEDRRRITRLEETSATKEHFETLSDTVSRVEDKIDRMIDRGMQR